MGTHIRNRGGDVIRRSHNLRGIIDYARDVSPVYSVVIGAISASRYQTVFNFHDGSQGFAVWNDWRVLADWLLARRSWRWGNWRTAGADNSGPDVFGHRETAQRYYGTAA